MVELALELIELVAAGNASDIDDEDDDVLLELDLEEVDLDLDLEVADVAVLVE